MNEKEIMKAAEGVADGWYHDGRIDWQDFLDRLEAHTDTDLGNDLDSPLIRRIKRHVTAYRKIPA